MKGQGPPPTDDPYCHTADAPDDAWTEFYDDVANDTQRVDAALTDAPLDRVGPQASR